MGDLRSHQATAARARKPFRFPSRLYPIIDTLGDPQRSHLTLAGAVLAAGVPLIQLRVKGEPTARFVELARAVKSLAEQRRALLIVNDRCDIAKLVNADGVHLGQDDLPASAAREMLGPDKVIGFSTHSLDQARQAQVEGVADYLGFGPVFATLSKERPDPVVGVDGLRKARLQISLPLVGIGGIDARNLIDVLNTGADAVALIGAIATSIDPCAAAAQLLRLCGSI